MNMEQLQFGKEKLVEKIKYIIFSNVVNVKGSGIKWNVFQEKAEMDKGIHDCEYYHGKIQDVTIRHKQIHCRRCGNRLEDSQVNSKILNQIRNSSGVRK